MYSCQNAFFQADASKVLAKSVRHTARITDPDSEEVDVSTSEKQIRGRLGGIAKETRAAEFLEANPPILLFFSASENGPSFECDASKCRSNYLFFSHF